MQICKKCLIPSIYPGAEINAEGLCSFCVKYLEGHDPGHQRVTPAMGEDLERTLKNTRGEGRYDCIIFFSGGKDSIYLINRIKRDYRLRILAYTTGEGEFISHGATQNIRRVLHKLDVDHVQVDIDMAFMKKLIKFLFMHQCQEGSIKTISYNLLAIRESFALELADAFGIPIILNGFSPGQPDPELYVYEMPREHVSEKEWVPRTVKESGIFTENELAHYWDPARRPGRADFPRILSPLHVWDYSEENVSREILAEGLINSARDINPMRSNSRLVWLMMYSDLRNLGYIPYMIEFAQIVREGRASRRRWLFLASLATFMIRNKIFFGREIPRLMKELDLSADLMRINQAVPGDILPQYK